MSTWKTCNLHKLIGSRGGIVSLRLAGCRENGHDIAALLGTSTKRSNLAGIFLEDSSLPDTGIYHVYKILRYLQPNFRDRIIKPCGSAMWSDLKSDSPLDLQALLWDVQGVFPKASMKNCKYASRNRSDIPGHSLSPVASPNIENARIFCSSCFQQEMRCSHNINRSTILSFECPYRLKSTECPTAYLCTWD